jgi:hypothetical protein
MMLLHHNYTSVKKAAQVERLERRDLHDQELEINSTVLFQSHRFQKLARLTLYGEYEPRIVTGIVTCSQRDNFPLDTDDPFTGVVD